MHYEIQRRGDSFTGEEEEFMELFELVVRMRRHGNAHFEQHREKMLADKEKFVELLKQRTGKIIRLIST